MLPTLVLGPAYLDRVVRVDRPLLARGVLDGSVAGHRLEADGLLQFADARDSTLLLQPDPRGSLSVRGLFKLEEEVDLVDPREVFARDGGDDLGGMGAGFAAALGGELIWACGDDAVGDQIAHQLESRSILHRQIRMMGQKTDWTLLVSSGPFGDKLAIGFRGCHAGVERLPSELLRKSCGWLIVAGFSNRVMAEALTISASRRLLAPAMRNMIDRDLPLSQLAGRFDVFACNRAEFQNLQDAEAIRAKTPLVSITDGANGGVIFYRDLENQSAILPLPAFPRSTPPVDTNRAGEVFAATLITYLEANNWTPGPTSRDLVRAAGLRASAAAALVLDMPGFEVPTPTAIDAALKRGIANG